MKENVMDKTGKAECPWCGKKVPRVDREYGRHYQADGAICSGVKREIPAEKK